MCHQESKDWLWGLYHIISMLYMYLASNFWYLMHSPGIWNSLPKIGRKWKKTRFLYQFLQSIILLEIINNIQTTLWWTGWGRKLPKMPHYNCWQNTSEMVGLQIKRNYQRIAPLLGLLRWTFQGRWNPIEGVQNSNTIHHANGNVRSHPWRTPRNWKVFTVLQRISLLA